MNIKKLIVFIISICLGSASSSLFIHAVNTSADIFQNNWENLILFTPIAGLSLSWLSSRPYFRHCEVDHSTRLAPFTFLTACWSHLFGASVGRESAAVQIGTSITETLRRFFKLQDHDRNHFMTAGTATAFAAAMGLPISSIFFAVEYRKKWDWASFFYATISAICGYAISTLLKTPHWHPAWLEFQFNDLNWILFTVFILGVTLISFFFQLMSLKVHNQLKQISAWKKLVSSGILLSIGTLYMSKASYNNFGVPIMEAALNSPASLYDLLMKFLFTEISILGLWRGGLFVPYMCIGALIGSFLSRYFIISSHHIAGGISIFALINLKFKIPVTSIFLTGELLGWKVGLLSIPLHLILVLTQKSPHLS